MRLNRGFLKFISSLLVILMVWGCSNVSSLNTASPPVNNNSLNQAFTTKAVCDQWVIRLTYSDDYTDIYVNDIQIIHSRAGDNRDVNINQYLHAGDNVIRFETYNDCSNCGGNSYYYWNYQLLLNGSLYFNDTGDGTGPDTNLLAHSATANVNFTPCVTPTPTPTPTVTPVPTPRPTIVPTPVPTIPPTTPGIPEPPNSCPAPAGFSTKVVVQLIQFLIEAYELYNELSALAERNPQVFDAALANLKSAYMSAYNLACSFDNKAKDQAANDLRKSINDAQKEIDSNKTTVVPYPGGGSVEFYQSGNNKPKPAELIYGKELASKGNKVFIHGKSHPGFDFTINGTNWEHKGINVDKAKTVYNSIRESADKGQIDQKILDGRPGNLSLVEAKKGIEDAERQNKINRNTATLVVYTKEKIYVWPESKTIGTLPFVP